MPLDRIQDMWEGHGGGFYALGAVGTFVVLEVLDLAEAARDLAGSGTVVGAVFQSVFSFAISTIMNTIQAAMWPMTWALELGMAPALLAGGGLWAAWRGGSALLERGRAADRLAGVDGRAPGDRSAAPAADALPTGEGQG